MFITKWLKQLRVKRLIAQDEPRLFPNLQSCVRKDMSHVSSHQMPPLMVRKAAWRR